MDMQNQTSTYGTPYEETMIRETRLVVAGYDVCYRLYECRTCFLIELSLGADRCRSYVGNSFSRAAYVYELLVRGEVTPCTMQDIIEDYTLA